MPRTSPSKGNLIAIESPRPKTTKQKDAREENLTHQNSGLSRHTLVSAITNRIGNSETDR